MKIKTSELTGAALDWAVLVALYGKHEWNNPRHVAHFLEIRSAHALHQGMHYSTDWSQGGPIIEREGITLHAPSDGVVVRFLKDGTPAWCAHVRMTLAPMYGPTSLIAAMRCFVASRLGDEVDVPEELL